MKFKLDDLRIEEKEIPEIRGDYSFGKRKSVKEDRTFCLIHCSCDSDNDNSGGRDYSEDCIGHKDYYTNRDGHFKCGHNPPAFNPSCPDHPEYEDNDAC